MSDQEIATFSSNSAFGMRSNMANTIAMRNSSTFSSNAIRNNGFALQQNMQVTNFQAQKPALNSEPAVEGVEPSRQECPITGTVGVESKCPMRHLFSFFSWKSE